MSTINGMLDTNRTENLRLKEILKIARQLPNDALALVEQVCHNIHNRWNNESNVLPTVIKSIENDDANEGSQIEYESQLQSPGRFQYFWWRLYFLSNLLNFIPLIQSKQKIS